MPSNKRESRDQPLCDAASASDSAASERSHPANPQTPGGLVVVMPTRSSEPAPLSASENERMLDRRTQAAIGRQLRSLYNDIATEPVPERFLKLLDELEKNSDGSTS